MLRTFFGFKSFEYKMIDDEQPVSDLIELMIESRPELKSATVRQPNLINLITCADYHAMSLALDKSLKISEVFPLRDLGTSKTYVSLALFDPGQFCYVESGWGKYISDYNKHVGIERPLVIYVSISRFGIWKESFIVSEACSLNYLKNIMMLANMRPGPNSSITIMGLPRYMTLENGMSSVRYFLENDGPEYFPEAESAIKYYFDDIHYNSLPLSQLKFHDDYHCEIDL